MASNFGLAIDRNSDGFGLQLAGDFDGTSAYEWMPIWTVSEYLRWWGFTFYRPVRRAYEKNLKGVSKWLSELYKQKS